jgi:isopentenyldiphosphate isomerase
MIGGPRMGSWQTTCASDPRFNMRGRSLGSVTGGVPDMDAAIRAKQKELGMSDTELDTLQIEISFCKD